MIDKRERTEMPKETNHGLLLYNQINDQTKIFKSLIKMLQWESKKTYLLLFHSTVVTGNSISSILTSRLFNKNWYSFPFSYYVSQRLVVTGTQATYQD